MIVVILYLQIVLLTIANGVFISVHEQDLTGEDKRLAAHLAQRTHPRVDVAAAPGGAAAALFMIDEPPTTPAPAPAAAAAAAAAAAVQYNSSRYNVSEYVESGRRQHDVPYHDYLSNLKILDLMRQSIYRTRERIEALERILKPYENDDRFRIAYLFAKLDQWEKEMRGIYEMALHYRDDVQMKQHIYYYEHLLKRHVDVTYSLQLLYTLHHKFMERYNKAMAGDELEWSDRDIKSGAKDAYDKKKAQQG